MDSKNKQHSKRINIYVNSHKEIKRFRADSLNEVKVRAGFIGRQRPHYTV